MSVSPYDLQREARVFIGDRYFLRAMAQSVEANPPAAIPLAQDSDFNEDDIAHEMRFYNCTRSQALHTLKQQADEETADERNRDPLHVRVRELASRRAMLAQKLNDLADELECHDDEYTDLMGELKAWDGYQDAYEGWCESMEAAREA